MLCPVHTLDKQLSLYIWVGDCFKSERNKRTVRHPLFKPFCECNEKSSSWPIFVTKMRKCFNVLFIVHLNIKNWILNHGEPDCLCLGGSIKCPGVSFNFDGFHFSYYCNAPFPSVFSLEIKVERVLEKSTRKDRTPNFCPALWKLPSMKTRLACFHGFVAIERRPKSFASVNCNHSDINQTFSAGGDVWPSQNRKGSSSRVRRLRLSALDK